ncbi:MAG: ATP-binding cassette domain-containing protein [Bdellovibrionales bacterium]
MIEGEDWQSLESEEKHKLAEKIGMLFQNNALFDAMTVGDNIRFPLREHHFMPDDKIEVRVKELLKLVNLSEDANKFPHELSGGMQRRLGIARALALSPEIVFYDDPTAGQDPVQSDAMADYILELKNKFNTTLIVVTCDLNVAYKMAGRILMVVDDEVLEVGNPETIKTHPDPRVQQFIHGRVDGPIKYS